jgi:hypothetical protein
MLFDQKPLDRFELVNIVVPASSTLNQFFFPDLPNLRNAKVDKITSNCNMEIPRSPDNDPLVAKSEYYNAYLILNIGNSEYVRMPLINTNVITGIIGGDLVNDLQYRTMRNTNGYIPIANLNVYWSKSYIKLVQANSSVIRFAFQLGVYYHY